MAGKWHTSLYFTRALTVLMYKSTGGQRKSRVHAANTLAEREQLG